MESHWLLILIPIILLGVWLLKSDGPAQANEPLNQELLRACLDMLFYKGLPGAEFIVRVRDDARELVVSKYFDRPRRAGLQTQLVNDGWMQQYYVACRDELTRRGIRFRETREGQSDADQITVDFDADLGQTQFVVTLIFEYAFGARLEKDCVGYFNNKILAVEKPALTGASRSA